MGDETPRSGGDEAIAVRRRRALELGQRDVLERIARGQSLHGILERIVELVEDVTVDAIGSILLLDRDGVHVRHGAARRLPDAFVRAIDGAPIGPNEGSCGAAAYLRRRVIVDDIATHPNWAVYKEVALPVGLRACWSTPILAPDDSVLGTFAIYYTEPRSPASDEIEGVDVATHLAEIAIERARSEEDLRASERRYRQIFESVTDVVMRIDVGPDGTFRFGSINPAFTRATGLLESEVVGRSVADVIPAASHALVFGSYRRAIAEKRTVTWDETSEFPAGTRHGHVSVTPVFDEHGVCTHLVGTVHDVSDFKVAEARIAAQASLLDKAHDAIIVMDVGGTIRFWSEGAVRLYGFSKQEAVGCAFADLVPMDDDVRDVLRARLHREGDASAEVRRRTRSGATRIVESSATLVRDDRGEPTSVLLIESDITERRSLEAQFHRAQRIESLGTLAGGVAHDFNNILTGILGNVDAALHALPQGHRAALALGEIEKASWRAADLTRRILTFSRRVDSSRAPIDLRAPIGEAVALLRATILPPIEIHDAIPGDLPLVLADATSIHQVVMNLGTNAAHAIGAAPGRIDVAVEALTVASRLPVDVGVVRPGRYVVISVRDDGCGMDRATVERIFEPFFTTKTGSGTGLGLSVVHGVVMSHEGAIEVTSARGRGTKFRVFLPALDDLATTDELGRARALAPPGQGERVLFVDDEPSIVALAEETLPRLGYRVDAFTDPRAALAAFERDAAAFDVVVTDSAMSGMTGFELIRAVRRMRPDTPVLVISSHIRPGDEHLVDQLGIDAMVPKPLVFDRIGFALQRALTR